MLQNVKPIVIQFVHIPMTLHSGIGPYSFWSVKNNIRNHIMLHYVFVVQSYSIHDYHVISLKVSSTLWHNCPVNFSIEDSLAFIITSNNSCGAQL